jgi:hypothetical protein
MTEIKVDKNIPLPTNVSSKYPFKEMKVGDSFLITGKTSSQVSYLMNEAKKHGYKCISRTIDGGCRVWRIS